MEAGLRIDWTSVGDKWEQSSLGAQTLTSSCKGPAAHTLIPGITTAPGTRQLSDISVNALQLSPGLQSQAWPPGS